MNSEDNASVSLCITESYEATVTISTHPQAK